MSAAVAPSGLSLRLGELLVGLGRALAPRAGRDRAFAPVALLLCHRLSRILARVAAIVARYHAGTLRPPATSRSVATPKPRPPRDPLPRRRGWLRHRAPECGAYGEYLRQILAEPELAAIIQAAPQLRGHLRPLWRMLHPEPPPPVLQIRPASPPTPPPRQRRPSRGIPATQPPPLPAPRPYRVCLVPGHRLAKIL